MSELEELRHLVDDQEAQLLRYGVDMLRLLDLIERLATRHAWNSANSRRALIAEAKRTQARVLRSRGITIEQIALRVGRTRRTVEQWLSEGDTQLPETADYAPVASGRTMDRGG